MALTQYGVTATTLTPTTFPISQGTAWTITAMSYTNPNMTLTIGTHNLVVGQNIQVTGIIQSASPFFSSTYTITAVAATTITFNYGATTPGTYTSGGIVRLVFQGTPCLLKYINGTYFAATDGGSYVYSSDGVNWQSGSYPGTNGITGIDHDGTTYAISTYDGRIFTSTTLLPNSWTQRSTLSKSWFGIKWLGGSTNRWVAWGAGNASSTTPGTSGDVIIATSGATSWTAYSITGTTPSEGWYDVGFDGVSTVVFLNSGTLAVSTNGTGSFTGYARDVSYRPANTAGQLQLGGSTSCQLIDYNSVAGKWMAFQSTMNNYVGMSTAGSPGSPWTKVITQTFNRSMWLDNSTSPYQLVESRNFLQFDSASGKILTHTLDAGVFTAYGYSMTPTSQNTFEETYPLVSIQSAISIPGLQYYNGSNSVAARQYVAGYFNNRWVIFYQMTTSIQHANNYAVTILQ
jgi:hypothetical protein